jgi:hypothetical protein
VHVGSEEEMDFLGIPGLLEADQVRDLLHSRQSARARQQRTAASAAAASAASGDTRADAPGQVSTHEQLATLRRELNGLVAAWNHRTGTPHGVTHSALRKECGGPSASLATAEELQTRISRIRDWAARRRSG